MRHYETKGGVNLPIAISVAFAFLVVNYLPMFLIVNDRNTVINV